jgi:Protein of unknown function (DUF4065)
MQFDRDKFKQLVHYVIWKAGKRDWFGSTKLNKVLWFSDTQAFALTGKPITGATYIRQKYGPVPKAIMPVRSELQREGAIRVFHEGKVKRTTATSAPDMRSFASSEMAIIDWWIEHISSYHTAATISDKSHDYTWQIAEMGEEIPMVATFATRIREPTEDEKLWGKNIAAKLRLP